MTLVAGTLVALATTPGPVPVPAAAPAALALTSATSTGTCTRPARAFRPARLRLSAPARAVRVVRVPRTRSGAIGTPPRTRAGKWLAGWDDQTRPGSGRGSVVLVAHTWPDGSALGNALLRRTRVGARLVLRNHDGALRACYRVTERRQYRADAVPRARTFRSWGPEQLVVVVCSGRRLGPGRWTHRTVWYASPVGAR
ncbi:class F sortase [Nocardioides sp. J54]|uniref:class F sortase n=1 Tax=Nocardioides sp. J54 TaxID=935866 RepID=UPI0012F8C237|nr:class F sortase [Nocardioides sp. J54]